MHYMLLLKDVVSLTTRGDLVKILCQRESNSFMPMLLDDNKILEDGKYQLSTDMQNRVLQAVYSIQPYLDAMTTVRHDKH